MDLWSGEVICNSSLGQGVYLLRLRAPLARVEPGQFIHLRCAWGYDPLLRRPLSVHDFEPQSQEILLLYRVMGKGTAWLAERRPGDKISGLGPLGRGFVLPRGKRVAMVAGGMGVAPLFFAARRALAYGNEVVFLQGARRREELWRSEELRALGVEWEAATEDGSLGFTGLVPDLLAHHLTFRKFDCVFACGPRDMLAAVAGIAGAHRVPAQVSLEEHMACGLGACRGCVVPVYQENGDVGYENVCSDGPVFSAARVVWENLRR